MPQPIKYPCEITFEGLVKLPDHAAMLGNIVNLSTMVDSHLGYLLAYLSGTHATVAIAMFHAVYNTDAQRAMLKAAAKTLLSGAELEEFNDLMEDFRTQSKGRNRVVHNIWGTSPTHPGKAVWCDIKDYTQLPVTLAITETADALPLFAQHYSGMWKHCSLYTLQDFSDIYARLSNFSAQLRTFMAKLLDQHPGIQASAQAAPVPISEQGNEHPQGQSQGTLHQLGQSGQPTD